MARALDADRAENYFGGKRAVEAVVGFGPWVECFQPLDIQGDGASAESCQLKGGGVSR